MLTRLRPLSRSPLVPAPWAAQKLGTFTAIDQRRAFGTFLAQPTSSYHLSVYRYPPPFFPPRPVDNPEENSSSPEERPSPFHILPPTRTNGTGDYTLPPLAVGSVLNNHQRLSKDDEADARQLLVRVVRFDHPSSFSASPPSSTHKTSPASVFESNFVVSFDDQLATVLRNLSPLLSKHFKTISLKIASNSADPSAAVRNLFAKGKVEVQCELLPGFAMDKSGAIVSTAVNTVHPETSNTVQLVFNGGLPIRTGDPGIVRQYWRYMSIFGFVVVSIVLNAYYTATKTMERGLDPFNKEDPEVVKRREEVKVAMEAQERKQQESQ